MLHYVHSSLIYNSQKLERTQMPLKRGMDTENVVHYTMKYYSAIKKNAFMKFLGKQLDLEGIVLSEVIQSQKNSHDTHSLISEYQPRNLEYPRYNLQNTRKIKKKEDQLMDTSFLLRLGNKIPMEGVTETKYVAEWKGWTIQRLPYPGIHPIISHQTQTLLHMPARFC